MKSGNVVKIGLAIVLFGVAGFGFTRFFSGDDGISEKTFYYDLSEKKLFSASRELVPPIRGLNNSEEDAVRAVVISKNGNANDKSGRTIAYLEKFAPELRESIAKARAGKGEPMPRGARDSFRLVKRVDDAQWHAASTPEGQAIINGWNVAGPDGKFPVVCIP
jgi:hypothetical protein